MCRMTQQNSHLKEGKKKTTQRAELSAQPWKVLQANSTGQSVVGIKRPLYRQHIFPLFSLSFSLETKMESDIQTKDS